MSTKDIYKINGWLEEDIVNTQYSSYFHPLRSNQSFPYIDKIKYYERLEYLLEKYIIEKLQLIEKCKIIPNKIELTYESLNTLFEDIYNKEEKQDFFQYFCFYIKDILSSLQGCEIVWYIQNENEYIDNFTLRTNNGEIDGLDSHEESDYLKIFIYLLNVLKLECYKMEGYSRIPSKIKK